MKIARIQKITFAERPKYPGKPYQVYIGNGYVAHFKSKRTANAFLADANRFLAARLFECNHLFGECLMHYRQVWLMLDNNHPRKQLPLMAYSTALRSLADRLTETFERLPRLSKTENGNYYAFLDLQRISDMLTEMAVTMEEVWRTRSIIQAGQCAILQARARHQRTLLSEFGHREAESYSTEKTDAKILSLAAG